MKQLISVIVPIYKVEQYLPKCIESIINQTYRELEIILVDDGSPDNCGRICEGYAVKDKRIKVFHKENGGLSDARNFGISRANGEYISFVDSDDWINLDMYEVLVNLAVDSKADIVSGGVYLEYLDRTVILQIADKKYNNSVDLCKALIKGEINNGVCNNLYHKSCFSDIAFPKGHVFEEFSTMYKFFLKDLSVVSISRPFYHYRQVRKNSITNTYTMNNLIDFWLAHKARYDYFSGDNRFNTDQEIMDKLYYYCALAIGRTWGWYYASTDQEKEQYASELKEMQDFCIQHFPLSSISKLPLRERIPLIIGRFNNKFAFALLYYMLQGNRWVRSNVLRRIHILSIVIDKR